VIFCGRSITGTSLYFFSGSNWNGSTETDVLPSGGRWTVKLTSFDAFVLPTVTDIEPRHVSVRLSAGEDELTIYPHPSREADA
jgi:hypothetical protein